MRNTLFLVLYVAVSALFTGGFAFFFQASSPGGPFADRPDARVLRMVSGSTCFALASGLLIVGIFVFRRRDEPPPGPKP
jgi:hypothetical protein